MRRTKVAMALAVALAASMEMTPAAVTGGGLTVVAFTVNRKGELVDVRLAVSGGAGRDQDTMDSITAAAPFPPLPEGADEEVNFEAIFVFSCVGRTICFVTGPHKPSYFRYPFKISGSLSKDLFDKALAQDRLGQKMDREDKEREENGISR